MRASGFTARLARESGLSILRWVLEPGMGFGDHGVWWGERRRRERPHNGLDLRLYESAGGGTAALGKATAIPPLYAGRIVSRFPDFLGETLVVAHDVREGGARLTTWYGHVVPAPCAVPGARVGAGEVLATLADAGGGRVPPHLHLTAAFLPESLPSPRLRWRLLDEDPEARLLDPEPLLGALG